MQQAEPNASLAPKRRMHRDVPPTIGSSFYQDFAAGERQRQKNIEARLASAQATMAAERRRKRQERQAMFIGLCPQGLGPLNCPLQMAKA